MFRPTTRSALLPTLPKASFLLLVLAVAFLLAGCDDDSTSPEAPAATDFSGVWDIDLEVIAKRTCTNAIGSQFDDEIVIAQDGSRATLIVNGRIPVELTINGSSATGSTPDGSIAVALSLAGGVMSGNFTVTSTTPDCTEVLSVSGSRINSAPAAGFAGNWDFGITVTSSDCVNEPVDSTEDICLSVAVDGNTVSITDEDGVIMGVGDGNTATLFRFGENDRLTVLLTLVDDSGLTGEIQTDDIEDNCQVFGALVGTKRTSPCPPPPEPGEFAGSWLVDVYRFSQSGCAGEQGSDYFAPCMTVTVVGSDISVDDGSGRGPVTGTIDGDSATLARTEANGTYTLRLELAGDELMGEAAMNYTSGDCAGSDVEISFDGLRLPAPCSSGSTGAFAGFWNITGVYTDNGCNFGFISLNCTQFLQFGDTVFDVSEGVQGTVNGNDLTLVKQDGAYTFRYVIQLADGGDAFTAVLSVTFVNPENPEESCTSTANMTGTRTTGCSPGGGNNFGLGAPTR